MAPEFTAMLRRNNSSDAWSSLELEVEDESAACVSVKENDDATRSKAAVAVWNVFMFVDFIC